MKENYTDITLIVDRSGSMANIAKDMEGGIATFVSEQKTGKGQCSISMIQFDHALEKVFVGLDIQKVPEIKLIPRGSTALLDAIGQSINDAGARYASLPEEDRPEKVLFVIITDGAENSSREFSKQQINEMITLQRDTYKWEFIFLGADQNAIAEATQLGIHATNSYNFGKTAKGTDELWKATSKGVLNLRDITFASPTWGIMSENVLGIDADELVKNS